MKNKDTFENKLQKLQEIVEKLDSAEEPIEDLIKSYEEGMKIAGDCRTFLETAENKIIDITKKYSEKNN
ncbi:MAG: exodeoxyribonuclease VII small subunit [Ignavibacteria bacterium]|jgi:exodeoxyribonuclease VII small subunit|nr:exodeoxyribonuclease VII small subunit [Ignavibacteria bacterium]